MSAQFTPERKQLAHKNVAAFAEYASGRLPPHISEDLRILIGDAEVAADLYTALVATRRFVALAQVDADPEVQSEAQVALPQIDAALAKARGEQ